MRGSFRTFLVVSLAVVLMAFFLRNADLRLVWAEILGARWDLLLIALLLTLGGYLCRVERWRYLLAPIGRPSFASAFQATMIGFAVNAVMPGRVGEVLRPYVLARRERLSATAAFATIVIERLLDLLIVFLLFCGAIAFFDPQFRSSNTSLLTIVNVGAGVAGFVAVTALVLMVVVSGNSKKAKAMIKRLIGLSPGRFGRSVVSLFTRFLEGLTVMRQVRPLVVALLWSAPLWVSNMLSTWCVTHAFGIDVPLSGAVILMSMVVIGVAVPTPAGVGGYHAAYELGATALYGADADRAVGAALVMHLFSFGPVALLGFIFMTQEGFKLGRLSDLTKSDSLLTKEEE
jgi:uncharacterized protein (TIRG00374 family)